MKLKTNKNDKTFDDSQKHKLRWWKVLLWLLIISFSLLLFPLIWIPSLVAIVVFAVKKSPHKKRNIILSSLVALLSFGIMMTADYSPPELTGIEAEWDSKKYDISDSAEVTITPIPSTAEIESLTLSENSIATMEYRNGKAQITFKAEGSEKLFFTANKSFNSDPHTIKVVDKKAEKKKAAAEKKEKERIAAEKAEAEKIAAEQAEAERIAAEQAEAERIAAEKAEAERIAAEQAEAERIAAEQAEAERIAAEKAEAERIAAEQAEAERIAAEQAAQQQAQANMVWIPRTGSKYHSRSSCSNMKNPSQVTLAQAQAAGYEPCKKCY